MSALADKPPIKYGGHTYDVLESDDPAAPYQFGVVVQKDGETVWVSNALTRRHAARLAKFWIDSQNLNKGAK